MNAWWRRSSAGAANFKVAESVWFRALGLIYFFAFGSFAFQIVGLLGARGISPVVQFLVSVRSTFGVPRAFWAVPSLLWLNASDGALLGVTVAGCVSALALVAGRFSRLAASLCFVLYLSIVTVGEPFTNFQWDALLLESGFLALFAGKPLLAWAYRILLWRLMFESGVVKWQSHDPNWRNLHALRFHFTTQPLPTPLAYYAQHLPSAVLDTCTAVTLIIEIAAPFLLIFPRPYKRAAGVSFLLLQVVILLTGNYAFFNLLTIALCVWAFDDTLWPARAQQFIRNRVRAVRTPGVRVAFTVILGALMLIGIAQAAGAFNPLIDFRLRQATRWLAPFEVVNSYGLFAVMTTTRPEIIVEGSNDGQVWREYRFRYKPGDLRDGLHWVAPYQPRLDWQMWFAALGSYQDNPWAGSFFYRLLTGEPSVLHLLGAQPFATPPRYVRALVYEYSFTNSTKRANTGNIWQRKLVGTWFGPVALRASQ